VEEKERAAHTRPPLSPPREPWEVNDLGNDGLVSVRSAKWGEFLGTLDGVDHWEVRGSGGLAVDWSVDLSISAVVKNSLSDPLSAFVRDGWSWRDWTRFVGLWKREQEKHEQKERSDAKTMPQSASLEAARDIASRDSSGGDDVLKSSTDKLSAVLDWISEQVPGKSPSMSKGFASMVSREQKEVGRRKSAEAEAKDPRLKFDPEKFYIALTRKLYNEGL